MEAKIIDKDERGIGVRVTDNNDIGHTVAVGFDGDIQGHSQEGYSDDPTERTPNENEHVTQAREYARYHVWKETEYEPFPVEKNLPGIKRVREALQELSMEQFRELFEKLYHQVTGKFPGKTPPVALPSGVDPDDWVLFMVDVYLDDDGTIEAVSDIHLRHYDQNRDVTTQWNDDPFPDRKADARIQLGFDYVNSLEAFPDYLDYHLRCQIRDCYIGAGMEPPQAYRVLGLGQDEITARYLHPEITLYEEYHEHHADISGYTLEYDYGLGEFGKTATQLATLTADDDELDQALDAYLDDGEGLDDLLALLEERGYDEPERLLVEMLGLN